MNIKVTIHILWHKIHLNKYYYQVQSMKAPVCLVAQSMHEEEILVCFPYRYLFNSIGKANVIV
jgi:hypothetical protein